MLVAGWLELRLLVSAKAPALVLVQAETPVFSPLRT